MRRGQRGLSWAVALSGLHLALAVATLLAGRYGTGVIAAAAQATPQWLWPGLALVLVTGCGLWRKWGLVGANLVVGVLASLWLGGLCLGWPRQAGAGQETLRVLVWNVGDELGWMDELERVIEAQSPDVICLCEAQRLQWERGLLVSWPRVVVSDAALFTRLPVVRAEEVGCRGENGRYRSWLSCTLRTASGPLEVLVAHIIGRPAERDWGAVAVDPGPWLGEVETVQREQAGLLEKCLPPEGRPSILAGDFNSPPGGVLHRRLERRLVDAWAATRTGLGLTFVARRRVPLWRLDYIWCGGGVRPLRSHLGPYRPSDHRVLVVDVALPQAGG